MIRYPVIVVPFMKVSGMAIFPFILVSNKSLKNDKLLIRHESIHLAQEAELLVLPFYVIYFVNYLVNRFRGHKHSQAYENICFEREAYGNEFNAAYLETRKIWAWLKYL